MPLPADLRRRLADCPLALGGAPLGNLFRAVDDRAAVDLIRAAHAAGVRYFDTAPHYGHGLSEHRFGTALREVPRADCVLSTKVGRLLTPDPRAPRDANSFVDGLAFTQRWDFSADGVRRSHDDSLQRLGLPAVDLLFVHDVDVAMRAEGEAHFRAMVEGALPALAELKRDGRIGGYGLGVNDVRICLETLAVADVDVILLAGRYTLADQEALAELLPLCERRGVAIVAAGPFNSGILATGARPRDGSAPYFNYAPAPAPIVAKVAALEAACARFDVPLRAAALRFPRAHPAVACVLMGARAIDEFADNLALARRPIPAAFWRALRDEGLVDAAAPLPAADP